MAGPKIKCARSKDTERNKFQCRGTIPFLEIAGTLHRGRCRHEVKRIPPAAVPGAIKLRLCGTRMVRKRVEGEGPSVSVAETTLAVGRVGKDGAEGVAVARDHDADFGTRGIVVLMEGLRRDTAERTAMIQHVRHEVLRTGESNRKAPRKVASTEWI